MANTITAGNATNGGTAISSDTSGTLELKTGSTPTTAIAVDASQNVGIGTSSPSAKLQVNWTSGSNTALFQTSAVGQDVGLQIQSTATNGGNWAITTSDSTRGSLTNSLAFQNKGASTFPMLIDSSGYVTINQASASANLTVKANNSTTAIYAYNPATTAGNCAQLFFGQWSGAAPNNTSVQFQLLGDSVGYRMYVQANGGIYNYSANNSNLSDRREKKNFALAKPYLDTICSIPVQTFNYVDQNMEEDDGLTLGVVAQDVQAVAPELVTESNWGSKEEPRMRLSIYQTDLQYALMKCIQELKAELDATKAEVAALKGA